MIIFIHGEDDYSSRKYLDKAIAKFKQKYDKNGENVFAFDSSECNWENIASAITASGLFSSRKLIVVKNIFLNKDTRDLMEDFLDKHTLLEDISLIIYEKCAPDKRSKLYKQLSKDQYCQEFPLPSARSVERFLVRQASVKGKKINQDAALKLASIVGSDMWRAHNEIKKLSCLDTNVITIEDVRLHTHAGLEEDIWKFIDALSTGDKKTALCLVDAQLESSDSPQQFLGMIIRQVRLLIALLSAKGTDYQIAEDLKLHPFVVKKTRTQARAFRIKELKSIYQALYRLDIALKRSKGDPKLLFTVLVDRIAQ